jgi:hypothetical protein
MECHWTYHTCVSQKQSCCNWKELICTHKHSNDNLQNFTLRMTNSREMGNPQNLQNKIRKQMPRNGQQDVTIWPDLGSTLPHLEIAWARSTYAAFVPVPKMTAIMTSSFQYRPPAKVPTVSLTWSVESNPHLFRHSTSISPCCKMISKYFSNHSVEH